MKICSPQINDELNKLSDEELDKVAGGTVGDTAEDSKLLYNYGLVDDWHGSIATGFYWGSYSAAVDKGWAKAGITCCTVPFGANKYFMGGKEISRDEAVAHLEKNFKQVHDVGIKPLPESTELDIHCAHPHTF